MKIGKLFVPLLVFALCLDICLAYDLDSTENNLVHGELSLHLPLTVFPVDTVSNKFTWFPVPEMGFKISPIFELDEVSVAFPMTFRSFTPFLNEYASLNDITIGAYLNFLEKYYAGVNFRSLIGDIYTTPGEFSAQLFVLDIGIPIENFKVKGFKFEWLASSTIKFVAPQFQYDHYQTSIVFFTPYWSFELDEGRLIASFRTTIGGNFTGTNRSTGESYTGKPDYVSMVTLKYVYP